MEIKDKYEDSIVFFRLGDFYEMFFEHAILASRVLELALTGKQAGLDESSYVRYSSSCLFYLC